MFYLQLQNYLIHMYNKKNITFLLEIVKKYIQERRPQARRSLKCEVVAF